MTYAELLEKDRPKRIKDTITKDEKDIMELYKESDRQRLVNESIIDNNVNELTNKESEFNMSGLSGCIQIC